MMFFPSMLGFIRAVAAAAGWVASVLATLNSNSAGWASYTVRLVIAAAKFTQTGSQTRITIDFGSNPGNIGAIYIGRSAGSGGTNYAFDSTPEQVLFGGSPTLSLPTGGTAVSDPISLAIDGTDDIVIAAYFSGSTDLRVRSGEAGWYQVYKGGNDASTVAATGYSGGSTEAALVSIIEVLQP